MTTLRVATLETLFTADDSGLVATVDRARQTTRDLDGSHAEVQVDADADAAAADLDRIADAPRHVIRRGLGWSAGLCRRWRRGPSRPR